MAKPPSNMKVLITGLHGFTGNYLETLLREAGYEIYGLVSGSPRGKHEYQVDMRDQSAVTDAVSDIDADYVIHLAAISFVAHGDIGEMYDTNVKGVLNLIEALKRHARPVKKLLIASSGNIYGAAADDKPVDEGTIPLPLNHYGVSKLAVEHIARLAYGKISTIIVRPFNYTGLGQSNSFVIPKIVSAFQHRKQDIYLGNIDVVRDFSDVRWVVKVYLALMESEISDETFNICSGQGIRICDLLYDLEDIAGYRIRILTDSNLLRIKDLPYLVGSPTKLESRIRVPPRIKLIDTLRWMYSEQIDNKYSDTLG
jgi:GDP-6-deoxy-D-talose 4-dehydrogenase